MNPQSVGVLSISSWSNVFNTRLSVYLVFLMAIALMSIPAIGQDTAPETLEQVVVEAERAESDRQPSLMQDLPPANPGGHTASGMNFGPMGNVSHRDLPFSFTSFTDTALQDRQPMGIQDALMDDPSVQKETAWNNYYSGVTVRGLEASYIFNGQPGPYGRDLVGSYEQFARIELLKSPGSFMSSNAVRDVGGVINLIPKRATDQEVTNVTFTKLPGSAYKHHLDVGRRFGPDDSFGLRVNAVSEEGELNVKHVQRERSTFAVALDHQGENYRLTLDLEQTDRGTFGAQPWVRLNGFEVPEAPSLEKTLGQPWAGYQQEQELLVFQGEYDLAQNWTAGVAFSNMNHYEHGQWQGYADLTSNSGDYDWTTSAIWTAKSQYTTYRAYTKAQIESLGIDHNLSLTTARIDTEWNAGYGAYTSPVNSNLYNPNYVQDPGEPGVGITPRSGDENDIVSLGDRMEITDRLDLMAGLQWSEIARFSLDSSGNPTDKTQSSAYSPLAGFNYDLTDKTTLYSSYSQALQPGQRAGPGRDNAGQTTDPTVTEQYQMGTKVNFGEWGGDLALFRTEKESTYVKDNVLGNFGRQRHDGVEATIFGKPIDHTQVTGGVTYMDAEQVKADDPTHEGNVPIAVPELRATFNMEYDVPSIEGLSYSGALNYTGNQYLDSDNQKTVPSWTTADLGASYDFTFGDEEMTAQVDVKNVTGEEYWTASSIGLSPGHPRSIFLSLKTSF
jgi:iron complex outermembrane receptor protein